MGSNAEPSQINPYSTAEKLQQTLIYSILPMAKKVAKRKFPCSV
jgi:hypothetical protein